jgi:disulfide oxidoreductase YuzD
MEWLKRNAPTVLLGVALLTSAALVFALCWNLTFFQDTWAFLLDRQDFSVDSFLAPHNEHIVVLPVLVTKLLLEVFGMTSGRPEMVVMTLTLLVSGALLFVYVRRRIGPWPALIAATLLLFLGSAWPILLWPFEIEFSGAVMAGIATLLLLDRDDRRGDAWACVLLTISIGFGSLGLSFAVAALVDVFQKRRSRGWRRAYVAIVPLLLYLVWYAGWGHDAEHHLTLLNILRSPQYLFDGFASSLDSLAGLSSIPVNSPGQPDWGRPLLIGAIALVAFGQWRKPGFSPRFWPVAAAAASYWLLAAFNFIPGREAASSRYVYAGAAFVLLMAADLLRGARFTRNGLLVAGAVAICAIGPNLAQMKEGSDWLKGQTVRTRADVGAMEIARRTIPPSFSLGSVEATGTASLAIVEAGKYFEAMDRWGSPAYSPAELETAPQPGRHYADIVLAQVLPLSTETQLETYGSDAASENCVSLPAGSQTPTSEVRLSPGVTRIEVAPGPEAGFSLRRFATGEYPVTLEGAPGESTTLLTIPPDNASQPWYLHVEASQTARVCR